MKDVLIDGIHGLDLGTGATNIPASALINFPITNIISSAIADTKPDIVVTQIAQPTASGDTLYFVNSSGIVVGSKIAINWTTISKLGTYYLDLYSLPNNALCDTARISGSFDKETTRDIRLIAYTLADFGITAGNASTITGFVLKASGTSDPAFIAYNADAFVIPAPVITVQPVSQVVCPNVSNSATFNVTATGGGLTYQWKKNNVDIAGATAASYTIPNVVTASAGAYTVLVSNPVGSVISNTVYLNISVAVQPSPASQIIATGASCSITISANNATAYQWKKGGVDIAGATASTYTINPVTGTAVVSYSVQLINSSGSGCANIVSNVVTVTGSTTLYSKPGVDLNLPGSWGVATNGTGSSPVNFTRAEHTFIVKNNAATGGNLTIAGTLDVANAVTTITANSTLDAGIITRSGTGSLAGSAQAGLTVRGTSSIYFRAGNELLKDFTVYGGTITLLTPLNITAGNFPGSVSLNGGTLITNDNLVFKSDINGTARLSALSGGAVINGKATVERYIPSARGWRLLSAPITATAAPTINAAWQEGVTTASANSNPDPGYGVQITGGTVANGFDQSPTNNPSLKIFDNSSNSFVRIPASPGTNIPITNYNAYSLYLRGDRGINLMQGLSAAITSTTLRMKGNIKTGSQAVGVNATNYTLVGNPYPSAIDFGTLTKNNVKNTMYIWDPKLAGIYGLGAYVTVSYNSQTGNYDATAAISPVSQYIQSGEAFFVESADHVNPGTLTIKEADKTALGNDLVNRTGTAGQELRVNLYALNANDSAALLDGVLTTYHDENDNAVNNEDAKKIGSSNEKIGIKRNSDLLAIERRKTVIENDTCFLNLSQMKLQHYKLEIIAKYMNTGNLVAVITDNYADTINNTALELDGTTNILFSTNADPASYAADRFSIVFQSMAILPVSFTSVTASQQQKDVVVKWHVENEAGILNYDVEKSADGQQFKKAGSLDAIKNSNGNIDYLWPDKDVAAGIHYYRIRANNSGTVASYSAIVKVNVTGATAKNSLVIYPNPVTGKKASLQFNNIEKGNYNVTIANLAGQIIKTFSLHHQGGNAVVSLPFGENLPAGKYMVKLAGEAIMLSAYMIIQ